MLFINLSVQDGSEQRPATQQQCPPQHFLWHQGQVRAAGLPQRTVWLETKVPIPTYCRMFLSDGCALMCAEIENKPAFKVLKENSLLRVEVKYSGMEVPLQILSMEIVQADYQYVFGNPIPFIDFLNKQPNHKNWQESQNGTPRHSSQDS